MAVTSDIRRVTNAAGALELSGAPEGFDALVMSDIARARGGLNVFVARDGSRAAAFADAMAFFAPETDIIDFPAWDCLPYDRSGPSAGIAAERMAVLTKLARGWKAEKPALLVTTAAALLQRTPPRAAVSQAGYSAAVGANVDVADLERYFAINGYQRASTVSERGEFAVRGGVIDVFPPGASEPARLDLFGDTLESIRGFDRETQRSTRQLRAIDLLPVSETLLDAAAIARFRNGYLAAFGAPGDDPLYATVSEGGRRAGMEHWLPLFYETVETLFDYLPPDALIGVDNLARDARDERLAMIADAFEAREQADRRAHYRALPPQSLYLSADEWDARFAERPSRQFTPFQRDGGDDVIDMGAKLGRTFAAERAQDSVNLFEATADARTPPGRRRQAGAVRLLVGGIVRTPGRDASRPRPEERPSGALLAGGQGGGPEDAATRRPAAGDRVRDRQPGGDLRDGHSGGPAGAAQTAAAGVELPGRGHGAGAGRPGGAHRPRHRPL